MTRQEYEAIIGSLNPRQLAALRVTIMAEHRVRTHYQAAPGQPPSLEAAYAWAMGQVP